MTRLGRLPNEIILLILRGFTRQELYECALVNRSFHSVTTPLLWATITLVTKDHAAILDDHLPLLGQYVRSFDVMGSYATDDTLLYFLEQIPLLQHLSLFSGSRITDISILLVPCYCRHLTSLYLVNTNGITQLSFEAIGQHCRHLRNFGLQEQAQGSSSSLSPSLFAALECCPLEKLSLGYFHDDTNWACLEKGMADLSRMSDLTHFALWNAPPSFVHCLLTTVRWPKLTQLAINGLPGVDLDEYAVNNDSVNIDCFGEFLQAHPHLSGLDLRGSKITYHLLSIISACLPELTNINLSHCTSVSYDGVYELVTRCPCLTSVHLMFCGLSSGMFPNLLDTQLDNEFQLNKKAINEIAGKSPAYDDYDEDDVDTQIRGKHWSAMFGTLR
ncbi:hypothetical protein BCR42DRAFT_421111 [Absidia repens]|uniref:F-box domain-containing protein n=1 Tax=Absidia repens TaxID=90262 RepID=A0A1X2I9L0_9FUNG|nr:hypothetical protein BCR42DRAFT_421111 [Absidia repens]